ncbi:MAG: GIY-YIG nuclease family protein [Candidatus Poribacteria bacterium]|nr:GIY-YIG nuclease family protein [Candidatus Poribacteria bacterium]
MLTKDMVVELPSLPGVYFFRSRSGEILYIGKAKSLRKRVRSYLYQSRKRPYKIKRLVHHATQVDYKICVSELEALLLESRLIKHHQPPYNTALKTVLRSPFIKISVNDDFPKVELVFEEAPDGAQYFGPFSSIRWTRQALDVLHRIFPIRTCEGTIVPDPDFSPCFSYHLKRCPAPCAARIRREAYRAMIDDVVRLLRGEHHAVIEHLRAKRDDASAELRFEHAAVLQKRIEQIERVFVYLDVHRRHALKPEGDKRESF